MNIYGQNTLSKGREEQMITKLDSILGKIATMETDNELKL